MGRQLIRDEPVFRAALEQCDAAIRAEAGFSVLERLAADEMSADLERAEVVQPMLFAMAVAQASLWRAWGVEPDAVVGHSMGEVAAAHVAGALSLADAAAVICRRGRLLRRIRGQGEMALVELSWIQAEAALSAYADRLSVAVSNGPRATVIAGDRAALSEVLHRLERRGVFCRRVAVDFASHSAQVDPLRDDLIAALSTVQPQVAAVPMRSTVTGAWVTGPELRAAYWADNLRQPVRFLHTIEALLEDGHGLFVEVSPHPILAPTITEIARAAGRACVAVGSTRRGQPERATLLDALGTLHVHGYPLAWDRMVPAGGRRDQLPTYPWERQRYWIDVSSRAGRATGVVMGAVDAADTAAAPDTACGLDPGWRNLPASARRDALASHLRAQAASVLRLPAPRLDPERVLSEQGMDSMMAAELRNRIHKLGVVLRLRAILEGASVATLTDLVLAQLGGGERIAATDKPDAGRRTERNPWIHVVKRNPNASVRLVCFPYAGGGPPVFARWPDDLPDSVELGVVHLPGRGSRLSETRLVRMEQVVEALTPAVAAECAGRPFAFLGHSLGAMIMFEVAHRLRRDHGLRPVRLFVSGARAPHFYHPEQIRNDFMQYGGDSGVPGHELPESQLLEMIHDLGFGASRGLDRDEEMRRLMLSTFRADFEINNTYTYADRPALDTPITAMGGRVDPFVNAEQLLAWRRHTTGAFSASFCSGGHDFIEQQRPLWAQVLARELPRA
jgi:surfactin synthase thioesterase subunit